MEVAAKKQLTEGGSGGGGMVDALNGSGCKKKSTEGGSCGGAWWLR